MTEQSRSALPHNGRESLFDAARVENDWRTTPTDLGGWANRAMAMFQLAKRYHEALEIICDIGETRDVEVARKALGG